MGLTATIGGESLLERRSTLWMVAVLAALLFATTNLPWHLDDYDQAKQAFTSFEMVNEGHWFHQHTPNQKIATKPPLVGWISAAFYGLTRSWEAAWRLPSFLAAVALLVVLTRAAREAYGTTAALLAFAAFGLNLLSPRLATLVRTDMPLALVVFLLGLQIWRHVRSGAAWTLRDQLIVFALLTATMLVKGPIVYAFLLPGIVAYQLTRRRSGAGGGSAWACWWPWIASLAIFLAWAAAGMLWVPGFYDQVVLREFAGRFSETVHRPQPLYFYFPHLLHKFAPWSVLALALAVLSWRRNNGPLTERWRRLPPEIAWLICWSLGGLLVMSLIPSKRVDRIFPIIPPLCLLLAAQFSRLTRYPELRPRMSKWAAIALIVACVSTSAYAGHKVITAYREDRGALARFGAHVRREAAANRWRYEVVGRREEGMLLYLHRTRFLKPAEAVEAWNTGLLDALVVAAEELTALLPQLPGAAPSGLEASVTINARPRRYVLVTRSAAPGPAR